MKFARELDENLVPEWRGRYVDYKQGKRKIKTIKRALARIERAHPQPQTPWTSAFHGHGLLGTHISPQNNEQASSSKVELLRSETPEPDNSSIAASSSTLTRINRPASLKLNQSALSQVNRGLSTSVPGADDEDDSGHHVVSRRRHASVSFASDTPHERGSEDANASVGRALSPRHIQYPRHRNALTPVASTFGRFIANKLQSSREPGITHDGDTHPDLIQEYEERQADFFAFLEHQLEEVEEFYKSKEDEAIKKLDILKDQLHKMRNLRLRQARKDKRAKTLEQKDLGELEKGAKAQDVSVIELRRIGTDTSGHGSDSGSAGDISAVGKSNDASSQQAPTTEPQSDFVRRTKDEKVPWKRAQRQLKTALQDFYRGLELLKNYESLNREGFRKINKKYDKAVQARPVLQFFHKKVTQSHFVQSGVIENCIAQVEDLYTHYFAHGNRKIAVVKLRSRTQRAEDFSGAICRNGALLAAGTVFALEGLVYAEEMVFDTWSDHSPEIREQGKYLLQIYAGFFLGIMLFLFFCFDAYIWTKNKINYTFIFEFDTRHNLDWKQLAEIPCLLYFFMGFFFFLNFIPHTPDVMFVYWPAVLLVVSVLIVFMPFRTLYWHSRKWWAISNFRMATAGLFPVEFRDFFLGDMYCSLTYLFGNIELFFCLYSHHWTDLPQCNASHSKTLGFLSAVPAIWRALQSIRRYMDSKAAFPHLANFGKYSVSIVYTANLSLYRVYRHPGFFWAFFTFGIINSIYSSLWDIFMDWHLMDPNAKLLRKTRGFKSDWVYYAVMIIDPILRFNWVFFAIFPSHHQHSAVTQFMVALSEVVRRGIWTIFRVENEHCTNVMKGRASKDATLPYSTEESETKAKIQDDNQSTRPGSSRLDSPVDFPEVSGADQNTPPKVDLEASAGILSPNTIKKHQNGAPTGGLGMEASFHHILERLGAAIEEHSEDFERKRRPRTIIGGEIGGEEVRPQNGGSDDDDDFWERWERESLNSFTVDGRHGHSD